MTCPPLKIGKLQLATNLLLAPMAGYCDLAFRLVVRACGAVGMGCTDLISADAVLRQNAKTISLAATCPEDQPLCLQLVGGDVGALRQAARWADDQGFAAIDINMGCPVEKVTRTGGGSGLLCDPAAAVRIVEKIVNALKRTPLTVKMRLGWDSVIAPRLARELEAAGVAAITVHGRTAAMKFSGNVSLEGIGDVVAAVKSIPVIGNGDVRTPQDAARMLHKTSCAGVMIGRRAICAPWIFRDTWSYLATGTTPPPPTLEEKCRLVQQHFENMLRLRGQRAAMTTIRQRVSWWGKEMRPCQRMREQIRTMGRVEQFYQAMEEFLAWRQTLAPSLSPPEKGQKDAST